MNQISEEQTIGHVIQHLGVCAMDEDLEEWKQFDRIYQQILDRVAPMGTNSELSHLYEWIRKVFEYNVTKGKRSRGLLVVKAYKVLAKGLNKEVTEEQLQTARILGWSLEILQAFALMMDDIMDESVTRRGQTCWHQKVGMTALIDAKVLEEECYHILKIWVSDKPYYNRVMDTLHEIMRLTIYGQHMDLISSSYNKRPDLKTFTMSRLETIYKHKTSYYTIVLPIRFALYLNSVELGKDMKRTEDLFLMIGHLFQMQDDFLDCYGDPSVTGKVGRDIEDGKCCWLIVKALEMCDDSQKQVLADNYGSDSPESVVAVRRVYTELSLRDVYKKCEDEVYEEICAEIERFKLQNILHSQISKYVLGKIYKRNR